MNKIAVATIVGTFAEDKDAAARLRRDVILPELSKGGSIEFDFSTVTLTTQSFIHALISEALRVHGEEALSRIQFKQCAPAVKDIVETVVQYVLESRDGDG